MKKILFVFGTRPEAIKMSPLVLESKKCNLFDVFVCTTGQHKELLDQVLYSFDITPDFDLKIMKDNQTLFDITISILDRIRVILIDLAPDIVLVHGDTTTSFATALACYYLKIPVGHIEAGLRTNNIYSPFPEEFNRQAVGLITKYHFAPTQAAADNLINEGKDVRSIYVTGNTAIDALKLTVKKQYSHEYLDWASDSKLIIITTHRRENFGTPMENIFRAIKKVVVENDDVKVIFPIHLNPQVRKNAYKILNELDRVKIVEPLDVFEFHNLISRSYLILTDSGGIQEEAPSLGIPVLVLRDTTERPEGVKAGTLRIVGTETEGIYDNINQLLHDKDEYHKMSSSKNPYGDGKASMRIIEVLMKEL